MKLICQRLIALVLVVIGGAAILSPARQQGAQSPTFNKEVVRILQKNCQTCHHPGDIGPMSLMNYQDASAIARSIKAVTQSKRMPPWKPVAGCGDFQDSRALSNEDIATLASWADAGAPEGNPADMPPPLTFNDNWPLGTPDLVLTPDEEYTPPVSGDMYRCFTIPTELRGDRLVSAIDVKPGNRRIVHHVIAYLDPTGASLALDQKDPGPGYTSFGGPGFSNNSILGGWAPGGRGYAAGQGNGIRVVKNSRVVIQVHYHPTGAAEKDLTQVGVYFARTPVKKEMQLLPLVNQNFTIPAGEKSYPVTASFTSPLPARVVAITPHMHLLGRQIKVEMTTPGKPADCLVNIDNWDFQWQGTYLYQNPVQISPGSRLTLTAVYDNSASNPLNPNSPPKPVRWGEATTDEMALAFIGFTLDGVDLSLSSPQLSNVTQDQNNNLVVSGTGFLAGADVEINGVRLSDTKVESDASAATKLLSPQLWRVGAAPGQNVDVTVINPDGVRTAAKSFVRGGAAMAMAMVSAASYARDNTAPEAIVAAFGARLSTGQASANTVPLPTTLAGTSVRVNGLLAPLFFVSEQQVNFLIPPGTQTGPGVIEIMASDGTLSRAAINVNSAYPSLFTANSSGAGAPAAIATSDGVSYQPAGNADGTPNPIRPNDFLVLFGTGFRRAATGTVKIRIGNVEAPVFFAGAQAGFVGLDQINTQIPAGVNGTVDLVVIINGVPSNTVRLNVKS
ncbi:MAG: hypothetical protein ACKV2V_15120 [Blastocatellia bacterium]